MKRSQATVFIVIGILIVIVVAFFVISSTKNNESLADKESEYLSLSNTRIDVESYVLSCMEYAVKDVIEKTGIRDETLEDYKNLVIDDVSTCSQTLFDKLEIQGFKITTNTIILDVELSAQTIIASFSYPIKLEKDGQKIEFEDFEYVFDRSNVIRIPSGVVDKESIVVSTNRKAEIKLPDGVKITDGDGNPVEQIGIRVEDLHFDNLENKYVVGQLVYENFPEGVKFSEPVEFSMEFDPSDIPEGYTEDDIMVSYWNEKLGVWSAVDTEIKDNRAYTYTTHFSKWSIVVVKIYNVENTLFQERYRPFTASRVTEFNDKGKEIDKFWLIGGDEGTAEGTALLQNKDIPDLNFEEFRNVRKNHEVLLKRPDWREIIYELRNDFSTVPTFLYGYYKDGEFVNCELEDGGPSEATFGEKYTLGDIAFEGDYEDIGILKGDPQVIPCAEGCFGAGTICECNGEEGCDASCDTTVNCLTNENGNKCIPLESHEPNDGKVPCYISTEICSNFDEENPVDGWHNWQCKCGKVEPAEGEEFVDFFACQKNGNCVILEADNEPLFFVWSDTFENKLNTEKLNKVRKINKLINQGWDSYVAAIDNQNLYIDFHCKLMDFPESTNKVKTIATFNSHLANKVSEKFEETGAEPGVFGFGTYGANAIVDTDAVKNNMHCDCKIRYLFFGNGFVTNTPDILSEGKLGHGLPIGTKLVIT